MRATQITQPTEDVDGLRCLVCTRLLAQDLELVWHSRTVAENQERG